MLWRYLLQLQMIQGKHEFKLYYFDETININKYHIQTKLLAFIDLFPFIKIHVFFWRMTAKPSSKNRGFMLGPESLQNIYPYDTLMPGKRKTCLPVYKINGNHMVLSDDLGKSPLVINKILRSPSRPCYY